MTRLGSLVLAASALLCAAVAFAVPAAAEPVADRLGLPGPYAMRGVEHRLAWSAQPSPTYVKQEYVPQGQTPQRFLSMVLVEYAAGVDPAQAAAAKVKELQARKPNDPTTNWAIAKKGAGPAGEILLDFTLSAPTPDGGGVSEWNAYRYAVAPGGSGVVLFAISRRAYGADRTAFYQNLKTERRADLAAFTALPMVLVAPPRN